MNWYSPGCFNCRQPIQWPPPQNEEQARLQALSQQVFQEQLAAWRASQGPGLTPAPAPTPTPPPQPRVQSFGNPVTVPPVDGNANSLIEATHHAAVQYDPQAAEDVEGFSTGTYGEFVPRDLPVQRIDELEGTQVNPNAPSTIGVTDVPVSDVERTSFDRIDVGNVAPAADVELASFSAITSQVAAQTAAADPLVERTAFEDHVRAKPAAPSTAKKKKGASAAGQRICKDCGTVSDRERCPSCGAATKEFRP